MANLLVFFKLISYIACLPPTVSSLPEECAERTGASGEGSCSDVAHHTALLQRQHDVRLPKAEGSTVGRSGSVQSKPNIVLFVPDDMYLYEYTEERSDGFAPYIEAKLKMIEEASLVSYPENAGVMPRLEKIARSGATFTRAYSTASTCVPSRYSIMTGRYPSNSQYSQWVFRQLGRPIVNESSRLGQRFSDTQNTVASALRGLGYSTGMVGKWHLSPFEEVDFGDSYSIQTGAVKLSGFDFVDGLYSQNMDECTFSICDTFTHNVEWLLDSALHFMDDAMRNEQPFFLYFAATPPHTPTVESALLGTFGPDTSPAGIVSPDISRYCSSCAFPGRQDIWQSATTVLNKTEVGYDMAFLSALRWVDESLGALFDFLSERAAIGNTYIVIASDQGWAKKTLTEYGLRVPLYAVGPGIPAGTRVDEVVSHVDLAPTFLQWAGCCADSSMPIPVDGLSWSSLASAEASSLDREGVDAEYDFDRAFVSRDGIELYTSN